jgi:hypothetical protein
MHNATSNTKPPSGVYNIYLLQAHEWYEKKERLEVILKPLMYSYEWSETSEVTDEWRSLQHLSASGT